MKTIGKLLGIGLIALLLWGCNSAPTSTKAFVTKWKGEAGKEIKIPILGTYTLTWYNEATPKDRHTEQVTVTKTTNADGDPEAVPYSFTPPTDGTYVVEAGPEGVEGMLMSFENASIYATALQSVVQFGEVAWKYLEYAFLYCKNMHFDQNIDVPNLSNCPSLKGMFMLCSAFNEPVEHWDVSKVTDMSWMFSNCDAFNQPLEKWNVSHVTNMDEMFCEAISFNQPLEKWNVSQVKKMRVMFSGCPVFNQPLNQWDVSNVEDMGSMFFGCPAFNQPLDKWNVSKVKNMYGMFEDCKAFNQSLEAWDVSHVESMENIFKGCPAGDLPFVEKWKAAGHKMVDEDLSIEAYGKEKKGEQ